MSQNIRSAFHSHVQNSVERIISKIGTLIGIKKQNKIRVTQNRVIKSKPHYPVIYSSNLSVVSFIIMLPSSIIFANIIISCSLWCLCTGSPFPFISLWSQTCENQADTNHEEFKGTLEQKDKFNTNNWAHTSLLAILILICSIVAISICCCAMKYGRVILIALRLYQNKQNRGIRLSSDQQSTNPPYNAQTSFMGRVVQFVPNPNRRETEGNLEAWGWRRVGWKTTNMSHMLACSFFLFFWFVPLLFSLLVPFTFHISHLIFYFYSALSVFLFSYVHDKPSKCLNENCRSGYLLKPIKFYSNESLIVIVSKQGVSAPERHTHFDLHK